MTAPPPPKPVSAVIGPRDAGPGERQEMLARAHRLLDQAEVGEVSRIDVPAKGYAHHTFPVGFSAHWVRVTANRDCTATAYLHYT